MSPVHGLAVVFGLGLPLVARAAAPPADTNAIESLTPDQARSLAADSKGEELTTDVCPMGQSQAGGLQRFRVTRSRGLSLNGLKALDAETARGLTACRCLRLHLGGLADLTAIEGPASAEIVRLLATSLAAEDGRAAFHGLAALSPAAAEALAADPRWDGRLPGLTAFTAPDSVAVAKALASRKGMLALPNLEKISPKTLSALIEKQDAEIPLIETLELIAEPDGSATDDFVIPDGFHERQMKRQQGN